MARRTSPERVQEFRVYVGFASAMRAFLQKLHPGFWKDPLPDGTSYFERMSAEAERLLAEGRAPSPWVRGWKQAAADMLEMTRDLRPDAVQAADEFLLERGAVSLSAMRRRVWRTIPKALARGRIRNIDEFYVVKNVLDDDGEDLSAEERAKLTDMQSEFEKRARRAARRPKAPKEVV
jgi:hypothetical protein